MNRAPKTDPSPRPSPLMKGRGRIGGSPRAMVRFKGSMRESLRGILFPLVPSHEPGAKNRPLTPALSPYEGERENRRQSKSDGAVQGFNARKPSGNSLPARSFP